MGWQRPHDPRRREGVGKQAGRARCRAVSPPRRRWDGKWEARARSASEPVRVSRSLLHPGWSMAVAKVSVGPVGRLLLRARGALAFTCQVGASGRANRGARQLFHLAAAGGGRWRSCRAAQAAHAETGDRAQPCSTNFAGWTLPFGPGGELVPGRRPAGWAKAGEAGRARLGPGAGESLGSAALLGPP